MGRAGLYRNLNEGLRLWHEGAPHPAHEAWETAWHGLAGVERRLAQSLVQLAAARVKAQQKNAGGVEKLSAKAMDGLRTVRAESAACLGLDVVDLMDRLSAVKLAEADGLDVRLAALLPEALHEVGFVYLHGFASSPGSKKARVFVEALQAEGWAIRVPDLNEGDFENLTVTRALARARRCLFDRSVVVGSSMGGYLAVLLRRAHPSVQALVLMAPAFDLASRIEGRYRRDELDAWRAQGRMRIDHHGTGRPEWLRYAYIEDARTYPGRPPIPAPAYVLAGRRDEVVPIELIRSVVEGSDPGVAFDEVDDDHGLIESAERAVRAAGALAAAHLTP